MCCWYARRGKMQCDKAIDYQPICCIKCTLRSLVQVLCLCIEACARFMFLSAILCPQKLLKKFKKPLALFHPHRTDRANECFAMTINSNVARDFMCNLLYLEACLCMRAAPIFSILLINY